MSIIRPVIAKTIWFWESGRMRNERKRKWSCHVSCQGVNLWNQPVIKGASSLSFSNSSFGCSWRWDKIKWAKGSVCKVRTQDPENFDEVVKSLVSALFLWSWQTINHLAIDTTLGWADMEVPSESFHRCSASCRLIMPKGKPEETDVGPQGRFSAATSLLISCLRAWCSNVDQAKVMLEVPWLAVRWWVLIRESTVNLPRTSCHFNSVGQDQWPRTRKPDHNSLNL